MNEQVICDKSDLTAIADAIRASTGSSGTYNVPELSVAAVEAIGSPSYTEVIQHVNIPDYIKSEALRVAQ